MTADGAYDRRAVYEVLAERGAQAIIPPSRTAVVSGEGVLADRDAHIEQISRVGRRRWRQDVGNTSRLGQRTRSTGTRVHLAGGSGPEDLRPSGTKSSRAAASSTGWSRSVCLPPRGSVLERRSHVIGRAPIDSCTNAAPKWGVLL